MRCETHEVATRLLLVEDDHRIRKLLVATLTDENFEVIEASTGEDAISSDGAQRVNIAVVDLKLPGLGGIEVVRLLRKMTDIPIVILTAHGESNDVVEGLEAGADDFLMKPIAGRELVARLRAILRRTAGSEPSRTAAHVVVGDLRLLPAQHEATIAGQPLPLTRTEFEVLNLLATRSPDIVSRQVLLERVWGYDYLGDSRLVDMQIYRLRQKLESHGVKDKLITIRGVGFRVVP